MYLVTHFFKDKICFKTFQKEIEGNILLYREEKLFPIKLSKLYYSLKSYT